MPTRNIVILISGHGSNTQTVVNAGILDIRIAAVLGNSVIAAGLAWAVKRGIPTDSLSRKDFASRGAFDQVMVEKIDAYQLDLAVLAGFMRILTSEFCTRYEGRLMNIHLSILSSFTGLHTHGRAPAAGCRVAGCTIHFVTPELDYGPIISQGVVSIFDNDTADDIAARVLKVEHRLFLQAVADFAVGHLKAEGNRVTNSRNQPEDRPLLAQRHPARIQI